MDTPVKLQCLDRKTVHRCNSVSQIQHCRSYRLHATGHSLLNHLRGRVVIRTDCQPSVITLHGGKGGGYSGGKFRSGFHIRQPCNPIQTEYFFGVAGSPDYTVLNRGTGLSHLVGPYFNVGLDYSIFLNY